MSFELIDDAGGDPRNARALAVASNLAYLSADAGSQAFRDRFAMTARLFSVGNTQCFLAEHDRALVLAFRGTEAPTSLEGIKDWLLTDAVNLLILPEGEIGTDFAAAGVGARFHLGFMTALKDIWPPVLEAVEAEMKRKERPLWVTGHSLGGALAQLAAWRLNRKFVAVHQVYTYGAPMVGNDVAANAFDREFPDQIFRYVNAPDLVPQLPTVSLIANAYTHCKVEKALAGAGGSAFAFLQELAGRAVQGLLNASLRDDIWQLLTERIGAHDIANYEKLAERD
jgi:hypothetical protein